MMVRVFTARLGLEIKQAQTRKSCRTDTQKREKGTLGPERDLEFRGLLIEQSGSCQDFGSRFMDQRLFVAKSEALCGSLRRCYLNVFLIRGNDAELNRDGRRIFVIVSVIAHADQVGSPCKQEHEPQYREAKKLVKKRCH
jgi:hypothetical protein